MKKIAAVIVCFCVVSTLAWSAELSSDFKKHWPQWRGPEATGVAPYGDPPVEWDENKNIRWKIEIPGKGHASPIVWGDKIFVTTAIETDKNVESQEIDEGEQQLPEWRRMSATKSTKVHKFVILAINRQDGKILWQQTAHEDVPHEGTHTEGSWASNSPVTDGEHVYAYFGSRGLYCFDMQGNLQWEKDLGDMTTKRLYSMATKSLSTGTMKVNHLSSLLIRKQVRNSGKWTGMKPHRGPHLLSSNTMENHRSSPARPDAYAAMTWRRGN